ncbi:MAG: nitroalkane oxidase [Humibacillus sp.]|nr:nitroalkane oxidase [Humibacillus sp.]
MILRSTEAGVVAAPMAGGPSTPELVAAVGAAGGLGFLAGGYLTTAALAAQIEEVRGRTDRPFGVNLFVPDVANRYAAGPGPTGAERATAVAAYRGQVAGDASGVGVEPGVPVAGDTDEWEAKLRLVTDAGVPVVSFTFGLPDRLVLGALRRRGVECVVTVTDGHEAAAAISAGAAGLCVQGADAGGHRGTLDPTARPDGRDLVELVAEVVQRVRDHGGGVDVVAAGGIATPERAELVRAAGADAVQVGTALLLTPEAGTGDAYRFALLDPARSATTVTRAYSGRLARCLTTDFVRRHDEHVPAAYPEVHHVTAPIRRAAAAAGRADLVALWAGTGWREARSVPAGDVVAALAR